MSRRNNWEDNIMAILRSTKRNLIGCNPYPIKRSRSHLIRDNTFSAETSNPNIENCTINAISPVLYIESIEIWDGNK